MKPRNRSLVRFWRRTEGSSTVELVLALPLMLGLLFTGVDFGAVMLRQVFLDRAVDIATREVRLGHVGSGGLSEFREAICARTVLLPDCSANITIEMRPVNTTTWAGLDAPAQCVDRAEDIRPVLAFDPGAGAQELMLVRVCVVANPFIRLTGYAMNMTLDASGGYALVSRAAFANEPW